MCQWFLEEILHHQGLGYDLHQLKCSNCDVVMDKAAGVRLYRCVSCGHFLECGCYLVIQHQMLPLHCIQVGNGLEQLCRFLHHFIGLVSGVLERLDPIRFRFAVPAWPWGWCLYQTRFDEDSWADCNPYKWNPSRQSGWLWVPSFAVLQLSARAASYGMVPGHSCESTDMCGAGMPGYLLIAEGGCQYQCTRLHHSTGAAG